MEETIKNGIDIKQLRLMLKKARNVEEIKILNKLIPELTLEEKKRAHKNMDDGIYTQDGVLIGEKHPED